MEGELEKGHFDGVGALLLEKYFALTSPNQAAYLEKKDFQQTARLSKKFSKKITISHKNNWLPYQLAENNGLAMSSRNERFAQRTKARSLPNLQNPQNWAKKNLHEKVLIFVMEWVWKWN